MVDPVARTDARSLTDDDRLLARLAVGDERALGVLYDTYGAVVYALALAITQDVPRAESVVTDAFATIWRDAQAREARGSVFAWLSATVRSLAVRHRPAAHLAVVTQPPVASRLATALDRLSAVERQSIELAYFGGLDRASIARALGKDEGAITLALRTAMESLHDLVAPGTTTAPGLGVASV